MFGLKELILYPNNFKGKQKLKTDFHNLGSKNLTTCPLKLNSQVERTVTKISRYVCTAAVSQNAATLLILT